MLIELLVTVLVFGLIYWIVMQLPLPHPFGIIVQVIFAVIAVVYLLRFLGVAMPV